METSTCHVCNGTGTIMDTVQYDDRSGDVSFGCVENRTEEVPCPCCHGSGIVNTECKYGCFTIIMFVVVLLGLILVVGALVKNFPNFFHNLGWPF